MIPCACLSGSHVTFPLNFFPVLFPVFFSRTLFPYFFFVFFYRTFFSSTIFFQYYFPLFFSRTFFPYIFSRIFFSRNFFFLLFSPVLFFSLTFFSRTFSKVATLEIQRFKISVSCFSSTCRCGISIQTSPVGLPLDGRGARMRDLKGSNINLFNLKED